MNMARCNSLWNVTTRAKNGSEFKGNDQRRIRDRI